jgi:hypothetical protein
MNSRAANATRKTDYQRHETRLARNKEYARKRRRVRKAYVEGLERKVREYEDVLGPAKTSCSDGAEQSRGGVGESTDVDTSPAHSDAEATLALCTPPVDGDVVSTLRAALEESDANTRMYRALYRERTLTVHRLVRRVWRVAAQSARCRPPDTAAPLGYGVPAALRGYSDPTPLGLETPLYRHGTAAWMLTSACHAPIFP